MTVLDRNVTLIDKKSRIYIAGGKGMVGSAIGRLLRGRAYTNVLNDRAIEPELSDELELDNFFRQYGPEFVFHVGGASGGIRANASYPADLMLDNLLGVCNVVRACHKYKVKKVFYLASSCVYPKHARQPMVPDELMEGRLEPTSAPYATAKLAGLVLYRAYQTQYGDNTISAITANTYGPGDNFHDDDSHVVPGLIKKFDDAVIKQRKIVEIWGTGGAKREFIYVDDLADACIFLMEKYNDDATVNIGSGMIITIGELAQQIGDRVGFEGELVFDQDKPDGAPIKSLDCKFLTSLGWTPKFSIDNGISKTLQWYRENIVSI